MDVPGELPLAVPLLCTLLALVLASLFVKLRGAPGPRAAAEPGAQAAPPQEAAAPAAERDEGGRVPVEEVGAGGEGKAAAEPGPPAPQREPEPQAEPEAEPEVERKAEPEPEREAEPEPEREAEREAEPEVRREAPPGAPRRQEDAQGREEDLGLGDEKLAMEEPEEEDAADEPFSFKYSPGKLRGNKYKSMMTKEELEEEQRVQREQLAAIFRLMKEKSDTFGEMSEGDMKEQLRLYDI